MKETLFTIVALMIVALAFVFVISYEPPVKEYPSPDGWVTDISNIMTEAEEAQLETRIQGYKSEYGHEIAVLILPTTNGESIESYSINVAEKWKVGTEGVDDGVLFVLATEDRTVRIEVGRGLESGLTDSTAGRILDDVVVPLLKEQRLSDAVTQGVLAINETILAQ